MIGSHGDRRSMQMNICKIIYLNCEERYEFTIDHHSYTHNLSSCEIKAWVRIQFRPEFFFQLCLLLRSVINHKIRHGRISVDQVNSERMNDKRIIPCIGLEAMVRFFSLELFVHLSWFWKFHECLEIANPL